MRLTALMAHGIAGVDIKVTTDPEITDKPMVKLSVTDEHGHTSSFTFFCDPDVDIAFEDKR